MFNLNLNNAIENILHPDATVEKYEKSSNQGDRDIGTHLTPEQIGAKKPVVEGDFTNLHNKFLTNFLASVHGIPLNTLWMVQIDISNGLLTNIENILGQKEMWAIKQDHMVDLNSGSNKNFLFIAQGIKVVGDSMGVDRTGTKNTGFIQGIVGSGRTPFPELEMSIIENNTSFIDLLLRPWMVALSHNSLKDFSLKTNITVFILGKMGSFEPLKPRKTIKYMNCCPIDIDTNEFNYTVDTSAKLRPVKFAYSHYEILDEGVIKVTAPKTNIEKYPTSGDQNMFEKLASGAMDKVVGKVKDLAIGTAQRIVTNTIGTLEDKFTNIVIQGEQVIRGPAETLIENINDAVNNAVGKDYKGSSIKLGSFNEVVTKTDDAIAKRNINYIVRTNEGTVIDVNKKINPEDTPSFNKPKSTKIIKIGADDVPDITKMDFNTMPNPTNDARGEGSASMSGVGSAQAIVAVETIAHKIVPNPPIDDARRGGIIVGGLPIDQKDMTTGEDILQKRLPNPPKTDAPSKSIKFIFIPTEKDDVTNFKKKS